MCSSYISLLPLLSFTIFGIIDLKRFLWKETTRVCMLHTHTHTHTNSVLDRPSTFQADVLTIKFSPTSFPQTEYCHSPFLHLRTRAHVFRPTTDVLIYIYIARDTFRHRNSNLINLKPAWFRPSSISRSFENLLEKFHNLFT